MAAKSKPNEIALSRVYDAPVNMVWDAWVEPEQVAQWWGPRGFTLTTAHKDVRTGGSWKYVMHGPDGTDYPNHTKFLEVEKHRRLVYDHGGNDDQPPMFRVTVVFTPVGEKTKMDMTMAFVDAPTAKQTKKFIREAGGNATWDRLAEYLAKDDRFVINRTFDAPIDLVFDMWTKPEHIAAWLPPTGFTMAYRRAEIRPGGSSFAMMTNGQGLTMYSHAEYRELERPHRIVYAQNFCDEHEHMSRHPLAPTWPAVMRTTVTLTAEDTDRTRVTIVWELEGDVTAEERATFVAGKPGMTMGWTGSFDKLEAYLGTHGHPAQE